MTALNKYTRLETTGLWRPDPDAQRREVIVSFGEASLVLTDGRTESALSHWSLPAIERRNYGEMPALYAPSAEPDGEVLEIDDPSMIEAIETVRSAVARQRPRRGILRMSILATTILGIGALAMWWLPIKLVDHATTVVPFVKQQEIGEGLVHAMTRFTGVACSTPEGDRALHALAERLFPGTTTKIVIVRDGMSEGSALALPGHIFMAEQALVEAHDAPEVLAGYLIANAAQAKVQDPLVTVLSDAGVRASFTLLATGSLPEGALDPQARTRLQSKPAPASDVSLLQSFADAGVSVTPYALSLDPSGQSAAARQLIENDPVSSDQAKRILPDADWLALQTICTR